MRRLAAVAVGLVLLLPSAAANADEEPAVLEVNFAGQITAPRPCTAEPNNPYEAAQYAAEGWGTDPRYGSDCRRLRFVFGPIHTKPGQNDVLLEPVTIQKPAFDGYVVRFEPNLIEADGTVPGVHEIHLHHAVWLNMSRNYGNSGFFATGEEKTILDLPKGYGLPVLRSDTWQLLYMIHNQYPQPRELFITYEVDVVPMTTGSADDIDAVYPIWLDVNPSPYPVFNAQRNFPAAGATECTWPSQNCAAFDPWGNQTWNQGCTNPSLCPPPDNILELSGSIGRIGTFQGGTIVHAAGHVHPGGKTVQVDLLRGALTPQRIFTSEAVYWNHTDHVSRDGPPTSWDMSMTAVVSPDWGIEVEPGDRLRITTTYDVADQSTYENMGIIVAWLAPDDTSGLDPFAASLPPGYEKGEVTHGHLEEAEVYGGANSTDPNLRLAPAGPGTRVVDISGFQYWPGDLDTVGATGIPTVPLTNPPQTLRFVNADAAANIWHSITSCAYPCDGEPGIAYPISDGRSSAGANIDFDSGQLGFWIPTLGPAKQRADWQLQVTDAKFDPGIYTFFCRVHPFMRGALEVTG